VLIEKTFTGAGAGKNYVDSFLITYRSFIEPKPLFDALVLRFSEAGVS